MGPFYATENDATIMTKVTSDPHGLNNLLQEVQEVQLITVQEGDFCVVDRGFRDAKKYLEDKKVHRSYACTER